MVQFDGNRLAAICLAHDVSKLRVFGSAARDEDQPDSDIDLLVDFARPKDFFDLIELEERLSELFGRPVDLLTEGGLSPYLRDPILASASILFDGAE